MTKHTRALTDEEMFRLLQDPERVRNLSDSGLIKARFFLARAKQDMKVVCKEIRRRFIDD